MENANSSQWGGIENAKTGEGLGIGPVPGRKKVSIYSYGPGWVAVLGYFRDEEAAREAISLLKMIAGAALTKENSKIK